MTDLGCSLEYTSILGQYVCDAQESANRALSRLLWSGTDMSRRIAKVKWDEVRFPEKGGWLGNQKVH